MIYVVDRKRLPGPYWKVMGPVKGTIARWMMKLIPPSSPDFCNSKVDIYHNVVEWWLEIDEKGELARREIGFDADGNPIVGAPIGKNLGIFTDGLTPKEFSEPRTKEEFEQAWEKFTRYYQEHYK